MRVQEMHPTLKVTSASFMSYAKYFKVTVKEHNIVITSYGVYMNSDVSLNTYRISYQGMKTSRIIFTYNCQSM